MEIVNAIPIDISLSTVQAKLKAKDPQSVAGFFDTALS